MVCYHDTFTAFTQYDKVVYLMENSDKINLTSLLFMLTSSNYIFIWHYTLEFADLVHFKI